MAAPGQGISVLLTYAEDGIYLMTAALLAATVAILLLRQTLPCAATGAARESRIGPPRAAEMR